MGGGDWGDRVPQTRPVEDAERLFDTVTEETKKARVRNVFISFHVDDEAQVNLLREQARSEDFDIEFRDYSVKEPFDAQWRANCSERIAQTSMMICMIGERTAERKAVIWELEEAYRQGKKVIGVRIYRDKNHPIPKPLIANNAPIIIWNLKLISRFLERK